MEVVEEENNKRRRKWMSGSSSSSSYHSSVPVNSLDDGCLMHIFSFLSPIPGKLIINPHPPLLSSFSLSRSYFLKIQFFYFVFEVIELATSGFIICMFSQIRYLFSSQFDCLFALLDVKTWCGSSFDREKKKKKKTGKIVGKCRDGDSKFQCFI